MLVCAIVHVRYVASFTEQLDPHALSDIASLPVSFTAGLPTFPYDITRLSSRSVFLNRRALASIIPGRERPEETIICYKISLVQLILI